MSDILLIIMALTPEAKVKIGSYYLGLLEQSIRKKEFLDKPTSASAIQDYLADRGLFFPFFPPESDLFGRLGFGKLRWQDFFIGDSLPLLVLGSKTGNIDNIQNADATIEIARRVNNEKESPDNKEPIYVRVAGVDRDTRRVVAAEYDADTKEVTRANVSLSPLEENMVSSKIWLPTTFSFVPQPSNANTQTGPYRTAGIITEKMIRESGRGKPHVNVLTIYSTPKGVTRYKEPLGHVGETDSAENDFGRLYLLKNQHSIRVGLSPNHNVFLIQGWEVSIPRRLGE